MDVLACKIGMIGSDDLVEIIHAELSKRTIPIDDMIVAPADGIITYIGESKTPIDSENKNQVYRLSKLLELNGLIKNSEQENFLSGRKTSFPVSVPRYPPSEVLLHNIELR